jgi:two-component system, sensor histidine kinase and response regulator
MSRLVRVVNRSVHVLIIEDSETDAALIEWELGQAGLHPITRRVQTESELLAAMDEMDWDVVICDYRLPQFSAPAALEIVKARGMDVPFLVISGSIGEDTAVEMMRSGAQDYLMKGNLARLGPAVERELRDAASRLRHRREAEQLTEARALYEAAAIHMTDGLMIVDPSDRVVFLNPRMEELKGMPAVEAVGRSLWDVTAHFETRTLHPEETGRLSRAARDAALTGTTSTFECRVSGDQPRDLVVFAFPIRGPEGQILGHGRLARDVTREREVDRLKNDFVSMVSHELRTPMNGVIAMTDLLLESPLDEDQRECAEIIRDSGSALVAIVNDILDVSHFQAGSVELEHIELDVRSVVERVVDLLLAPARQKGVELVGLVDRAVPEVLYGDPGRLLQVLTNLVGNAVKFTKEGDVSVQVRVAEDLPGDVVLRCEVVDTGIGTEAHTVARLFEPFSQGDSSVTRRYGGTGLGLAICKRIVDAWGGEIGVSTEPGVGSTFWFTIRLKKPTAAVEPRLSPSMRDLRVLVLDPHSTRRTALVELLAGWGVGVEASEDADAAIEALETSGPGRQFAVVLMTSPPGGVEANAFVGRLKGVCGSEAPPIVQLTASLHAVQSAGDSAWPTLSSPPHQSQLLELLAALVDRRPDALRRLAAKKPAVARLAPSRPVAKNAPRVLVVDDSEVNRRVAERMLARLGYRTESGDSGMVALNLLAVGQYAAVLMDCRMPDMDGFTATAEIRREERGLRRTPIIAMTANSQRGDRERCLAAGMDDYLQKPVQMADMERLLTHWISASPADALVRLKVADGGSAESVLDADILAQLQAFEEPGEASLLTELLVAFRGSAPGHVARLKSALAAGDASAFEDAAHVLKGSAATLGAARLRIAAYDLELRGRDHNLEHADVHLTALEAAFTEALEALSQEDLRCKQELAA